MDGSCECPVYVDSGRSLCVDSSHNGEARWSRKGAFAGPLAALLAGPEMQAADCKGRFAGDSLNRLRALIFWRPIEGDFESVRVPDLSPIKLILHTFSMASRTRERTFRQRTEWAASSYAEIACGHSIA